MKVYNNVDLLKELKPISVTYEIAHAQPIIKTNKAMKNLESLPEKITLICADKMASTNESVSTISKEKYNLYVDATPVSSDEWSYNPKTKALQYSTSSGKGQFNITPNSIQSHGVISNEFGEFAVSIIIVPLKYRLDIAKNAAYIATSGNQPIIKYDTSSEMWKNAWKTSKQTDKIDLVYHIEGTPVVGQEVYNLTMEFLSPDEALWAPTTGTYSALIDGDFNINFELGVGVQTSKDYELYPYKLTGKLEPFAQELKGAMLTGENSPKGEAYGIIGRYIDETKICGAYKLSNKADPFCVLGGTMYINGEEVENSSVDGTILRWDFSQDKNCDEFAKAMPKKGALMFSSDGANIINNNFENQITENQITENMHPKKNMNPNLGERISADQFASMTNRANAKMSKGSEYPSCTELLSISQYKTDAQGVLHDVVQDKATKDFEKLLHYYFPEHLYKQFINPNRDNLTQELIPVSKIKGDDGTQPEKAYAPFTTAYLTSLLASAKSMQQDPYAAKLNGSRADKYIQYKLMTNSVYQNQTAAIYRLEWLKQFPKTQEYIDDQKNNAAHYEPMIVKDGDTWKGEVEKIFDPKDDNYEESVKKYKAYIDSIVKETLTNKKYWAYFLLRYSMTPTFLSGIQTASITGTIDKASWVTQKVQQITGLITVLDDSKSNSIFVQEFIQMIEVVQLSNVIPILFDLSGDESLADYSYATQKILEEFAEKYINSADETLKGYATFIKSLKVGEFEQYYKCLVFAYNSLDGIFVYSKFVANFDNCCLKFLGKLPSLAAYSCMVGAMISGILMFATGKVSFKDLTTRDQVALIGTGVGFFAMVAVKITKRAMVVNLLNIQTGLFDKVKAFCKFSPENKALSLTNLSHINSGFRKWFIGEAGLSAKALQEVALRAEVASVGGIESKNAMVKIFGNNLDKNLARGLGGIFALIGLGMSIYSLCNDKEKTEFVVDSLFLAGSIIDLGAIAIGAVGFEAVSAGLGVVGVIITVIAVIIMIIYITSPKPTAIETFALKEAKERGYYIEYGYDIDSFEMIPPSGAAPSQIGIAVYLGTSDKSITFNEDETTSIGKFDAKASTCLGLDVNADGYVRLFTNISNKQGEVAPMYLTYSSDGTVKIAKLITTKDDTAQFLTFTPTGKKTETSSNHLQSGEFTISTIGKTPKYLSKGGAATSLALSEKSEIWTVEMKAAAASGLSMQGITLHRFDRDRAFSPHLNIQGSDPKVFGISPSLPTFMEFDAKTGKVSQKTGVQPEVMSPVQYTLSLTDALGNVVTPAQFTLQVLEATVI